MWRQPNKKKINPEIVEEGSKLCRRKQTHTQTNEHPNIYSKRVLYSTVEHKTCMLKRLKITASCRELLSICLVVSFDSFGLFYYYLVCVCHSKEWTLEKFFPQDYLATNCDNGEGYFFQNGQS
jgi:hypothetical protein